MSRKSNIELLRIIAMMMILALHANGAIGPFHSYSQVGPNLGELFRLFFEEACLVSVNVFVMISGWFGIKASWKGILSLFFQISFYSLFISLGYSVFNGQLFPLKDTLLSCLGMTYWFIPSYVILYVLSPFFNTFIETSSRKKYTIFLVLIVLIQIIYGLFGDQGHFHGGYSALSFIVLYILAGYLHKYPFKLSSLSPVIDIVIYLSVVLCLSLLAFCGGESMMEGSKSVFNYNNPLVILASVFLFLFFTKIQIQSKIINWLAVSSFAIYLIHMNFLVKPHYRMFFQEIYESYGGWSLLLFPLAILVIGILCIIVDKIRIVIWDRFWSVINGFFHFQPDIAIINK